MKAEAKYLFEVSWEVCNKVGGIYTVVSSKAARMKEFYGDNYFLIGPYFQNKRIQEFEEKEPPKFIQKIFVELNKEGIQCYFGKWLVKGEPNAILIDYMSSVEKKRYNTKRIMG